MGKKDFFEYIILPSFFFFILMNAINYVWLFKCVPNGGGGEKSNDEESSRWSNVKQKTSLSIFALPEVEDGEKGVEGKDEKTEAVSVDVQQQQPAEALVHLLPGRPWRQQVAGRPPGAAVGALVTARLCARQTS